MPTLHVILIFIAHSRTHMHMHIKEATPLSNLRLCLHDSHIYLAYLPFFKHKIYDF